MKTTTTIQYPFYKMDADLQQALIESLAKEIELHEEGGEFNPEDKAISRLAKTVFVISNAESPGESNESCYSVLRKRVIARMSDLLMGVNNQKHDKD